MGSIDRIDVTGERPYPVLVGRDARAQLPATIAELGASTAVLGDVGEGLSAMSSAARASAVAIRSITSASHPARSTTSASSAWL